jgi:hypothetical protein
MIKIVLPTAWDFDEPIAQLVECHSKGVDSSWLIKRAAAGVFRGFDDIKPQKDHSLIHLIALGDAETYGGNRNGDWFYKTARHLDLPMPNWDRVLTKKGEYDHKSPETFTDKTNVGNLERAATFTKFAHVFKHHKNRPHEGHKIYGAVKAAAHNDKMDRVELMIEVPHGKDWNDDLEKLASGQDIPWSMAAKVAYDICSVCGHKAKTRDDYCGHLQNDLTSMLKTGHVVGSVNDHMTFFDISRVIRPADRIAWSLTKAASADLVKSAADLAFDPEYSAYPNISVLAASMGPRLSKRAALLNKAAEIEKKINLIPAKGLLRGVRPREDKECKMASFHSLPDMYRALADAKVCLPFEQWAALTLGSTKVAELSEELGTARQYLNGCFSRALNDMDNVVGNSAYDPSNNYPAAQLRKVANDLSPEYGLAPEQIKSRAIYNTVRMDNQIIVHPNSFIVKAASDVEGLIQNYVAYKLAFLESIENSDPHSVNHFIEACVAQNCL